MLNLVDVKTISKEDLDKLLKLYNEAQNTPVIKVSGDTPDLSTMAFERVRDFQIELGTKYGYDWEKFAINGKGELIKIE